MLAFLKLFLEFYLADTPHRRNAQHFVGWLQTVTLFSMFHHDCAEKYDYHDCNDYYCDCCFHPFFTSVLFFFRTGSPCLRMECYGRSVHCKYQSSFLRTACSFLSRAMQNSGQRIVRNVQGKSKSNKRRNRTVTISVPLSLPAAPRST